MASLIKNCLIVGRIGGEPLFTALGKGRGDYEVSLDNYAILPMEQYERLLALAQVGSRIEVERLLTSVRKA